MFVRASVEQGMNDHALLVPIPGVTHNPQGQATTLVVGPDNKVVQRTIQTQNILGDKWVVTGGLNEGERVVVAGLQKVQPGMLVQAVEAHSPTTPAAATAGTAGVPARQQTPTVAKTVVASEAK
jgi:membrane fusion protein (multidrug efflux system)